MTAPSSGFSCCPTTDSLSTTASNVGILTFALDLFACYIALHTSTGFVPSEVARLIVDLRSTQHGINRVAEYNFANYHPTPRALARTRHYDTSLYQEAQALLKDCIRLFYEADDLLKRIEQEPERL